MKTFKDYLEMVKDVTYEVGKTYVLDGKKVEYLGTIKDNPDIKYNASDGDYIFDKWDLLFKWKEGEGTPSSHGRKDDIIALGKKEAAKRVREN